MPSFPVLLCRSMTAILVRPGFSEDWKHPASSVFTSRMRFFVTREAGSMPMTRAFPVRTGKDRASSSSGLRWMEWEGAPAAASSSGMRTRPSSAISRPAVKTLRTRKALRSSTRMKSASLPGATAPLLRSPKHSAALSVHMVTACTGSIPMPTARRRWLSMCPSETISSIWRSSQQNAQRRALPGVTPGRSVRRFLAAEPSRIRM